MVETPVNLPRLILQKIERRACIIKTYCGIEYFENDWNISFMCRLGWLVVACRLARQPGQPASSPRPRHQPGQPASHQPPGHQACQLYALIILLILDLF
jgi:hypothetical protein